MGFELGCGLFGMVGMLDSVGGLRFFVVLLYFACSGLAYCFIRFLCLALSSVLWVRLLPFGGVGCFAWA